MAKTSFSYYPGRAYLLIAGLLLTLFFAGPFLLVEYTRHGSTTHDAVILGIFPLFFIVLLVVYFWQTRTLAIDEKGIAQLLFGRTVQVLLWDTVGTIEFGIQAVPTKKPKRIITFRTANGRRRLYISDSVEHFERLASLLMEIASRRNIKVEQSHAYNQSSSA